MQPFVTIAVAVALVVLNFFGAWIAEYFSTMVFLDTVGTAMVAMAFGWWQAIAAGLFTNLVIGAFLFPTYRWFTHVNVLCGLAWALIAYRFPVIVGSDNHVILYIIAVGACVGLVSVFSSAPIRIWTTHFHSAHMLDAVDSRFYFEVDNTGALKKDQNGKLIELPPDKRRWAPLKVLLCEYFLGHFLDKTISTTVAVMFVIMLQKTTTTTFDYKPMYHDLIELLGAYYYVAMGVAIKALEVDLPQKPIVTLLGPLGFFGLLIALPTVVSLILYVMS
jgi:hypothetical protein